MSSVTFISKKNIDCFEKTEKLMLSDEITQIRRTLLVTCLLQEFHLTVILYILTSVCGIVIHVEYIKAPSLCAHVISRG